VLPIGGLKGKALAAQRASLTRVIAPGENEADLDEFPEHLREGMEFIFADRIERVLEAALEDDGVPSGRPGYSRAGKRTARRANGKR